MKKIWKRSLSLFLAFVMVFGMLPVSAFADETEPVITEETSVTEPVAAEAAESPVEETTVPVTEVPVVETTVPGTEAPEVETTAPETTVAETIVTDKVSDDPANSEAETPSEPEETEPVIQQLPAIRAVPSRTVAENDELFAAYADHVWFGTDISLFGTNACEQLNEDTRIVYDALVPFLKQIANGQRTSAMIAVGTSLGDDYEAEAEISPNWANFDLGAMLDALMADMPYEMYWYDKTAGTSVGGAYVGSDYLYYFYFSVAGQYNDGTYEVFEYSDGSADTVYYTASAAKIGAVTATADRALAVVNSVDSNASDYEKLLAYKDWICANTAYNKDVESGELTFSENIDPWQVIYVFDNDSTTDVVCEGYSKAFQYLCELTFSKEDPAEETVTCYSVTGTLVGEGDHMWNIVEIEGEHYLADITNSDEGTVGSDGSLFLVGGTPDSTGVYTFATKGTSTAGFAYDSDTKSLWGDSGILTLAESNYEPPVEEEPEEPDVTEPAEGMTQDEFAAELAANAGTNYVLSQSVTITEDMTIRMATEEVPYNHSVLVNTGATLTVASGTTLTMETNFMVGGGTVIVEDGGKLVIGTSNTRGMLYVWGGTLDVAAESGLDLTYGRITVQYGSDYEIPDWISESSINAQAYIREPAQLQEMLALTQYAFIDIYVQCDLTVSEDITIAGNQFLGVQYPYSMTVEDGVTVTVATGGVLFCSDGAVINNNGQILCYGQFQDYGTLNGNAVEIVKEEWDDAAFLEAMENAENNFLWLSSNVTISGNVEIPSEVVVYVSDNATVTVAEDATLTVNGQLSANGGTILVNGTLIKNGWMHTDNMRNSDSSSNQITISGTGEFRNNSGMFLGSGTLTIDGTYTPGENSYVAYDDTKAVINGIEKVGDQLQIQIIARSEEELISALEKRDGIEIQTVYADEDITLDSDLTVPGGVSLTICYSYGNDSDYKTLTIPEGVTLTVEGSLGVAEHGEIILEAGATIVNNGWIGLDGRLVKNGTVEGNDIEIFGGTVVAPDMTQSEFAAAVAEAERNGEVYFLERNVTLTGNMTLTSEVRVRSGASLTVDGCTLNILDNGNGDDYIYGHLIAEGGTITVKSNAALNIHAGLLQVWKGGFLTLEEGADLTGVQADEIWVHMTDLTEIPVSGLTANMLGAVFNPRNAAEIEDAFAQTNTYAHISVVPFIDNVIVLDRNIVIPAGDDLSLRHDITLKIPAGFTLTNNGIINLEVAGNRLEVLMDGTLVNNGTINVDEYAQFVVRGNLFKDGDESDIGTVNGSIIWGEMSHADLVAALQGCAETDSNWMHESETTLDPAFVNDVDKTGWLYTSDLGIREGGEIANELHLLEYGSIIVPAGCTLEVTNPLIVHEGGKVIIEEGGKLIVNGLLSVEGGTVYIAGDFEEGENSWIEGRLTFEGETGPYLSGRWLEDWGQGWFENTENAINENAGRGSTTMDSAYKIFYLNIWDSENLCWSTTPVVPTASSTGNYSITRLLDTDETVKADEENAEYFVRVDVGGTLDHRDDTIYVNHNGQTYTLDFALWSKDLAFYTSQEDTVDTIITGHEFILDTSEGAENAVYLIQRDERTISEIEWEINSWNGEDYNNLVSDGEFLTFEEITQGKVWKITVDPEFVDYVQYDYKNFELRYTAQVTDTEGNVETFSDGIWVQPPELKDPVAALNIDHAEYMIYDTGRIFRDYFTGEYDEWGNEIWNRQETALPKGVSYELDKDKIILDGVDLTVLNLKPSASGYDENGNFWEVFGLPKENLTISLVGDSIIENHCGPAVMIEHGMNVTVTGNGSLYAKTTNYPDYRDENGELQCFNTINVHGGSSLTIGGNATVTAELSGHGYWGNGEAATCHAISGSYEGDALVITDNATVTTVLPNGVRRYDNTGSTSQIGGYVGIQNFNTVTVSGGTLNTDHLNFYDGGQFNLTGGTANFRDIGGINSFTDKEGNDVTECHYEGINMRGGSVNISGGTLNIDVTASESDNCTFSGFYGINVANGTMDVTGGEINITANTDGWAILADCEWTEEGWVEGTGSTFGITGGTIHVNNADRTYHGGILISEICSGYFGGGEINDDYGIHRFCGDTVWENTVLNGIAANVYTHGPGDFYMSGGQMNLTGDSYEENGEVIRNRAIFQPNAGGSIFGGEINLINGTYINNMNVSFDGGKITIENDWYDVPGLENNLYFATTGGTIDITANGPAIANAGTFHQMGGEITATNTSGTRPVMVSTGTTMLNTGTLNIRGGNIGLVQAYDFDLVDDGIDDNESMLFVGDVSGEPVPELNISDTKIGLYLNGPAMLTGGAIVNIHAEGEPVNTDRDWPMAIYVEKHTGNPDLTGENVSGLIITGDANVTLVSEDTAGVDAMSKGIVAWYSPVVIQGSDETDIPKVTIDAEMAVYSLSDSLEETNFNEGIAFFDRYGAQVALSSRELTETEETGDYLHTLMDGDNYIGYASVGKSSVMSLDAFLAAVAAAAANHEPYDLTERIIVDRNVDLGEYGWVRIRNGGEIIVEDGAVLTNLFQINVEKGGKLTVEAGSRLVNQGSFIAEGGTVSISDDGDYAGYVHDTELYVGRWAYGTEISPVTGIPVENMILQAYCDTEDQVSYILPNSKGYFETIIILESSMTLHTMTIPENTQLSTVPDVTVTVAEGAFLTVNGGLGIRNGKLIVNGKLISNSEMTFNLSEVTINGTFDSNAPLFINDGSVMTVNGTLNSYAPLHVGFWRDPNTEAIAGTLNINGTLNNYAYLNICPDFYIEADNRYCGGIVNVNEGGTLDNTFDADAKVSGYVDLGGTLNVHGTMMNGQLMTVCGSLHLHGKLDNGGSILMQDLTQPELVTYEGAELINNTMIRNDSTNGVITLAEGTYTQGSHSYPDGTTEPGELDARFFDDQHMAQINGAPEGMVSIFYEGSNAEALLAASEAYNWGEGYYDRCFLRVVDAMTFPAEKELNLAPGTYLVVLNNGDNYKGSLTVEGAIFNQSYLRLFGADMTIPEGGWITNKGIIEAGTMTYEKVTDEGEEMTTEIITLKPTVTVGGLLENASTAKLDLSKAEVVSVEPGVIQNNLAGGNLGDMTGVPISLQTLFSDIDNGDQAHLQELIGMVQNDGYHGGHFWISQDMFITSDLTIPGNIGISIQDGASLTNIDPGVALYLEGSINVDAGGTLNTNGNLYVNEGIVDVRGTMTVNAYGNTSLSANAWLNVMNGGTLTVNGYFNVGEGTLNIEDGGTINNYGTIVVAYPNGTVNGSVNRLTLYMPINSSGNAEAEIQAMQAYAQANGFAKTQVHFLCDYTFENGYTIPANMSVIIGAYGGEDRYTAVTVTIPAGKTLTIDGEVQVSQKSALVIEDTAQLICNGSFVTFGSCSDEISWFLINGVLTIEGTGDMLDYTENSAPWAEYASLIKSVEFGAGITGITPEKAVIAELDTNVQANKPVTVTTESTISDITDSSIVGAALNAASDSTEVKLVINDASGENTISDGYTGTLFSMTLEGVENASELAVPVKITLNVPAAIKNPESLVVLHYENGAQEVLERTVFQKDNTWYVSFIVDGFSDFAIVEEAEPEIEKIDLSGTAMTLGNSLSMDFGINISKLENNGEGHYAVITKHFADGREDVITRVDRADWKVYSGSVYTASCTGISAKEMCDEVEIVVYNADGYAVTNAYSDSVKSYAMRTLNNTNNQSKTELLITIVDMLNYGAAAQEVFGYDTGNLANADLTDAQKALATTEIDPADARVKGPGYAGSTLTLKSEILLDFVFYDSTIGTDYTGMYAIATYTNHYGNLKEIRLDEFKVYASGYHYVSVSGMAVSDCGQLVTCTVYNSNGEAIASASDSVEGYIARQLASGRTDAVYTAILKFAASAYNYFH